MVPEFEEFILPTLQVLSDGKTLSLKQVREAVITHFGFSQSQLAERTKSGRNTKVDDRITWALTYLCQSSLVERPQRAFVRITSSGRDLLSNPPQIITRDYLYSHYQSFRDFNNRKKEKKNGNDQHASTSITKQKALGVTLELSEMKRTLQGLKDALKAFENIGCSATSEQLEQVEKLEVSIRRIEDENVASKIIPLIIPILEERVPKDDDFVIIIKRVKGGFAYVFSKDDELIKEVPKDAIELDAKKVEKTQRRRRPNLNFFQLGLINGDELTYLDDENITVTIVSENRVEYKGKEYSLTKLTQELKGLDHAVQPTGEWLFEDQNLLDLYNETYPVD